MHGLLAELYASRGDVPVRGGMVYPALLRPGAVTFRRAQRAPVIAGPLLARAGEDELARWLAGGAGIWDGDTVNFAGWDGDTLLWFPGRYFDMLRTTETLAAEISRAGDTDGLHALALRRETHELAGGDPWLHGDGRAAALACSGLLVVTCDEGRFVVLGRRGSHMHVLPDMWDVMPSGMTEMQQDGRCAPDVDVIRELCEELPELASRNTEMQVRQMGCGLALDTLRWHLSYRIDLTARTLDDALSWATGSDEFAEARAVELTADSLNRFWRTVGPSTLTTVAAISLCLLEREERI